MKYYYVKSYLSYRHIDYMYTENLVYEMSLTRTWNMLLVFNTIKSFADILG